MKIAVMLSGTGRTLENFMKFKDIEIVKVISSREDVRGVEVAKNAGLPLEVINSNDQIFKSLDESKIDLVCLAGWVLKLVVPDEYKNRIMNIHPSLLPAFGGQHFFGSHVHQAVIDRGCLVSGCTVHFVDNEYDNGPIIAQRVVPVLDDDTVASLGARVFNEECQVYPSAVRLYSMGHLKVVGKRVHVG